MELTSVLSFAQEFAYSLVVLCALLWYVIYRGRQATINLIFGLYFALLFTQQLPFSISPTDNLGTTALISIAAFIAIAIGATYVTTQLMPEQYREKKLESFGKKIFLAIAGTVLILLFSFHVLPVEDIITLTSPISSIFASSDYFFWLLIAPFVLLFFHK